MIVQTLLSESPVDYNGDQLKAHWIYRCYGLLGDAVVAFRGKCHVKATDMVDLVDSRAQKHIHSEDMLHFIAEHFDTDLEKAVYRQRLLVSMAQELINTRLNALRLRREGNDLYDADSKLSVCIATASPLSTLIHFGINISSRNTPVPTVGLDDYQLAWDGVAAALLNHYSEELVSIDQARCKVRWVQ